MPPTASGQPASLTVDRNGTMIVAATSATEIRTSMARVNVAIEVAGEHSGVRETREHIGVQQRERTATG